MAKTTPYTYDKASGRWRKNGRFAKPPRIGQLARDKLGRPLDANGKRVPAKAVSYPTKPPAKRKPKAPAKPAKAPTKRKPKAPPKRKPKAPAKPRAEPITLGGRLVTVAPIRPREPPLPFDIREPLKSRRKPKKALKDLVYLPIGASTGGFRRKVLSSTYENTGSPLNAGAVLYGVIGAITHKSEKRSDDVLLYEFGIQIINTTASGDVNDLWPLMNQISAEFPEYSFRFNENIVHVIMGDLTTPVTRSGAARILSNAGPDLETIWVYLSDLWAGDIGWFVEAENDDIEGGSGAPTRK